VIARLLGREELPVIWTIDRSEFIENIYRLQDGNLVLEPHNFQANGWPPGMPETDGPEFERCFERGARFHAMFDGPRLAAIAIVDTERHGVESDLVQLKFLHVGHGYRGQGTGVSLFRSAVETAEAIGAEGLYVSATPTQNTVDFYLRRGCKLLSTPDRELFALEPEDIHLEWRR
jgi:GNAT superfamily N-acetyltransferase